ncbi:MAG: hypothetical protein WAK20_17395 [Candidatus Acidiferrum sp.]
MKDRIRERLDYLRMNDNDATIPTSAIAVAVWKVEAEIKQVMDDWKRESNGSRVAI